MKRSYIIILIGLIGLFLYLYYRRHSFTIRSQVVGDYAIIENNGESFRINRGTGIVVPLWFGKNASIEVKSDGVYVNGIKRPSTFKI